MSNSLVARLSFTTGVLATALIASSILISTALAADGGGTNANGPISGTIIYTPENVYSPGSSRPLGSSGTEQLGLVGVGGATCAPYIQTFTAIGSEGAAVTQLQKFLNQYDGAGIPVTGHFGIQTKAAVQKFQTRYGIIATGNQFILTTTKINELVCAFGSQTVGMPPQIKSTAVCAPYLASDTKLGSTGATVSKLQLFLNVYINAKLPVTGIYGAQTADAVKYFQSGHKLPVADGAQSGTTTQLINSLYCAYGGTSAQITPKTTGVIVPKTTQLVTSTVSMPTVAVTKNPSVTDTSNAHGMVLGDSIEPTETATADATPWPRRRTLVFLGVSAAILLAGYYYSKKSTPVSVA